MLKKAICEGWMPNELKVDKVKEKEKKDQGLKAIVEKNRKIALKKLEEIKDKFDENFNFSVGENVIYLKKGKASIPLSLGESDVQEILNHYCAKR